MPSFQLHYVALGGSDQATRYGYGYGPTILLYAVQKYNSNIRGYSNSPDALNWRR